MKSISFNSALQNRSERLVGKRNDARMPINFTERWKNRGLSTQGLLALLAIDIPSVYGLAEVVGRWVWVQFNETLEAELRQQLAQLGFHWNRARQAWQHPCGSFRDRAFRGNPRSKYRSYFAADVKPL